MKRIFIVFTIALLFTGCATQVTIPLDSTPINEEQATLIIIHEQGFADEFHIFLDDEPVGIVTSHKPLKIAVEPGTHQIYTKAPMNVIDRITTFTVQEGQVQFMRIWLDMGMWAHSIRIDPTHEREFYNTHVTDDRLKELKETKTGYETE